MTSKILSIVIPVFNKYAFTKSCLKDLSQLPDDHEIIVVDNASSDETQKELQNNSRIIYHRNESNLGFAKACNAGYLMATAPNVLFLNNDIRVKSNFTDWTNLLIKQAPHALVGPTMGQLDKNFNFVQEKNGLLTGPNTYMSGWCLCSSKEIWNKLKIKNYQGPFSEEFFCYFEDSDLSFRAAKLKIDREVVSIPVVHFGRISSVQLNTGQLYKQAKQIFDKKWKLK
jgi:GT2 family glycosyltransferase